jgi:hypothetical protein
MKKYTYKILITYITVSDAGLPVKAQVIIDSVTNNAHFPNPPTPLADLQKAKDEYERSLAQAKLGDERAIAQKDILRTRLEDLLRALSGYVLGQAKNDPAILASSGFDISQPRTAGAKDTLSVTAGKTPGQVVSLMNGIREGRVYFHQYTPDPVTPESAWTEVMSKNRKYVHIGLQQYVKYWFRVKAVSKEGQEIYTDPVMRIVV